MNPCGGSGGGFGGGGGRGGGGGAAGPPVAPGTYNIALIVDGKTIETKPMKVVLDSEVQMNDLQKKRYFDMLTDLHDMQRKGTELQPALNAIYTQMAGVAAKVKDSSSVTAAVKTQFDAFQKEFDTLRVKFGVPPVAAGGGRGGAGGAPGAAAGGRGGAAGAAVEPAAAAGAGENTGGFNPMMMQGIVGGARTADLVSRAGSIKGQVMSFWELPSDGIMKQYNDLKLALPKAMLDANAFLAKVSAMSQTLKKFDITLNPPAVTK
jgi:hypothetical protein